MLRLSIDEVRERWRRCQRCQRCRSVILFSIWTRILDGRSPRSLFFPTELGEKPFQALLLLGLGVGLDGGGSGGGHGHVSDVVPKLSIVQEGRGAGVAGEESRSWGWDHGEGTRLGVGVGVGVGIGISAVSIEAEAVGRGGGNQPFERSTLHAPRSALRATRSTHCISIILPLAPP